ncbi:FAD-dependent monooxygenase [Falsirhodobacter algicola]|uniref:FAD-dependent oxidoreductase n=1 Tax=Falsirhodobacter algicola TaxID=2692330 RepID=A0A8J8SM34_9RHOB|nr:FAD-dependent monooxygenase [Falsirhodobacter algicola]QUS37049.1 FAD-dependent oxidoreductase [Falsirhodobacter algicola]
MTQGCDIVVVGGGPAGAHAATRLAAAGREVVVLERSTGPHQKICGEFLSHEAIFYLNRLGIDPAAMGAVPIRSVALLRRGAQIAAPLPFAAASLSRLRLDEALLTAAAAAGAKVRRGCRVRAVRRAGAGWQVDDGGAGLAARHLLLATGKHDLRGWRRPPGTQPDLIGFKQRFGGGPVTDRVELCLFDGGYCGIEPVEDGAINVSLLIRQGHWARLGSWGALWDHLLTSNPALARRMEGAVPLLPRPLSIAAIPYGHVRRRSAGAWHLGDQAAVIPSFAGDGIAMALHSGALAARHLIGGDGPDRFQRAFAADVGGPVARATLISRMLARPAAQGPLAGLARRWPGLMTRIAASTRIPADRLVV